MTVQALRQAVPQYRDLGCFVKTSILFILAMLTWGTRLDAHTHTADVAYQAAGLFFGQLRSTEKEQTQRDTGDAGKPPRVPRGTAK